MNHDPAPAEDIAKVAYQIYVEEGRPEGQADEHWARAQRCLREHRVTVPGEDGKKSSKEQATI